MPFFTYPLAWIAAITLPTLAAIYFLRHRFRKQPVSTLLLWQMHQESREGGRRIEKPKFPLVFLLELLVLLLLVLAATGPRWQVPSTTRPLIVILDDSQSMHAGSKEASPRKLALDYLQEIIEGRNFASYQLIAAGPTPRLLGDKVRHWAELEAQFPRWTCLAPNAQLESAIGLANALSHQDADILMLTDHEPESSIPTGRIIWKAFGKPLVNFAFINAARTVHDSNDRCLLEIANPSAVKGTNTLRVVAGTNVIYELELQLEPNRTHRLTLPVPANTPTLHAKLGPDALIGDNQAYLVPPLRRKVRVQMSVKDPILGKLIEETLSATGLRATSNQPPELIIHQSASIPAGEEAWGLRILPVPEKPERYTGPFVMDATHPLARGLSLPGIVWGANPGATNALGYLPVITAGNIPLLTHRHHNKGKHQLNLCYAPAHSTLHDTPQWPALFWNLLHWRTLAQPGLRETNHRLGSDVSYRPVNDEITLTKPDGTLQTISAPAQEIRLPVTLPGVYSVVSGPATNQLSEKFVVNFLAGEESSLAKAKTGEWGKWGTETEVRFEYASILPYLILLALVITVSHLFCINKHGGRV